MKWKKKIKKGSIHHTYIGTFKLKDLFCISFTVYLASYPQLSDVDIQGPLESLTKIEIA